MRYSTSPRESAILCKHTFVSALISVPCQEREAEVTYREIIRPSATIADSGCRGEASGEPRPVQKASGTAWNQAFYVVNGLPLDSRLS